MAASNKPKVREVLTDFASNIDDAFKSGNVENIEKIRFQMETLRKDVAAMTKRFDDAIKVCRDNLDEDDPITKVKYIIERDGKGRPKGEKKVDPREDF